MRTKYRSIGAVVLVATTMILAACIPPPEGPPRPQLTVPDDIEVVATSEDGAIVSFQVSGTFEGEPVPVVCDPSSSSLFPIGTTTVRCTATNAEGTERSRNFTVTVLPEGTTTTTTAPTSTTSTTTTTTTSTTTTQPGPTTTLPPGDGPLALAVGGDHTCAVRTDGTLACWGYNNVGQVGNGSITFSFNSPQSVTGLSGVTDVAAGNRHTCALRSDGQVFCWGQTVWGALGIGSTDGLPTGIRVPTEVVGMNDATSIAVGFRHSCAIRDNGTVWCWGDGFDGQLGGSQNSALTPRQVPGVTGAVELSGGTGHTCALLSDGSARCWGSNNNGQLGNGTVSDRELMPVTVALDNVTSISAGGGYTCATSGTTMYCWGENLYGQLGQLLEDGPNPDPLVVPNLTAAAAGVGRDHACVVLAADGVRCFGLNAEGQLGNDTRDSSLIRDEGEPIGYRQPVDAVGLSNVRSVDGGAMHSCARRTDDSVACWGSNSDGQLGIGTNQTRRLVPAEVSGL